VKRADTIVRKLTKGVEFLLKKNNIEIIKGFAKIVSQNSITVENRNIEAENIIIATGSKSPKIIDNTGNIVVEIKNLFTQREIPENIVIIGNDSVSIELAQFFSMINKNVTFLVTGERIMPLADEYLSNYLLNIFKKEKINLIFNTDIHTVDSNYKNGELTINGNTVKCNILINAKTRESVIPESEIKFELENGYLKTDDDCKTNFPNIFAVGDVNGKSHFAHIGSAQGLHAVNLIKGIKQKLDLKKYPLNMYSVPEMAQIGQTEMELKNQNVDYKISEFPLSANGKAMTEGNTEGFVRILSEKKYGEVLGVQIVAPNATDMIAEASAFMQLESTIYDVAQTVHAHPTISEVFMEAGFEGVDGAIHK
jgi:dihydrolipoamide dehydrogenase